MRFYFELKTIGLCVVMRACDRDVHHRIVAIEPDCKKDDSIHKVYLSFDDDHLGSVDLTKLGIRLEKHDTQWRLELPEKTIVELPEAVQAHRPFPPFDAPDLSALGLGRLKADIGEGKWCEGEQGLARLPKVNANAGWTGDLGSWEFAALKGKVLRVACTFMWGGWFDDGVQVDIVCGDQAGHITLKHSERSPWDTVKLAYSCIPWPEGGHASDSQRVAFGYVQEFARVTTDPWKDDHKPKPKPDRQLENHQRERPYEMVHAGSPSCPPVDGG